VTIGLICAIPQELAALQSVLEETHAEAVAHTRFVTGVLDGHDVVLAGSGMGKVNAAIVTTLLADRFGCRTIVFSGVAGGLDPALSIGDVVVADRIVQHDAGVLENERVRTYQPGHAPIINPTDRLGYPVDPELLARVKDRLEDMPVPRQIVYGTVLTGDQYLNCDTTRERLLSELDGKAIEMEGGAVAQVCEAFGLPWLVIRALSDLAGGNALFDFTAFVEQASATSATILRRLLPVL
jgi:adenosylhomocysteine nucleosidase